MPAPHIIFYSKTFCPWCRSMKKFFETHGLGFEEREVIKNKHFHDEMVKKTGQDCAPCVEINGHMLADTDAEAVEKYMKSKGLLK